MCKEFKFILVNGRWRSLIVTLRKMQMKDICIHIMKHLFNSFLFFLFFLSYLDGACSTDLQKPEPSLNNWPAALSAWGVRPGATLRQKGFGVRLSVLAADGDWALTNPELYCVEVHETNCGTFWTEHGVIVKKPRLLIFEFEAVTQLTRGCSQKVRFLCLNMEMKYAKAVCDGLCRETVFSVMVRMMCVFRRWFWFRQCFFFSQYLLQQQTVFCANSFLKPDVLTSWGYANRSSTLVSLFCFFFFFTLFTF